MTENEVKAKILNLSGSILMGKATKEEIGEVIDLAKEHALLTFLKNEFKDVGDALFKFIEKTNKPNPLYSKNDFRFLDID